MNWARGTFAEQGAQLRAQGRAGSRNRRRRGAVVRGGVGIEQGHGYGRGENVSHVWGCVPRDEMQIFFFR